MTAEIISSITGEWLSPTLLLPGAEEEIEQLRRHRERQAEKSLDARIAR